MKNKATLLALLALCFSIFSMAAGFTYTYRTDTPGASDDPREGDDRMREIKAAIQERITVDHYWSASAASTYDAADCGKHRWVTFQGPNTVSSVPENEGVLFTKDVSSKAELHFTDEDENEIQLTSVGKVNLTSAALLGVLANDTYLTAVDNAGTGTVDLIKATTGDVLQIPDASVLATSGAPTTDAMIANKKYVDDQVAAASTLTADGSTVLNATMTAANTWEDLDLSSYVGSNSAFVFLEVQASGAGYFVVKPKGYGSATTTYHGTDGNTNGTAACRVDANKVRYLSCITDSSGVVQVAANVNSITITMKLVGYVK